MEHYERLERRTRETYRLGAWVRPRVIERALRQTEKVSAKANRVFDDVDVLLTPTTAHRPPRVGVSTAPAPSGRRSGRCRRSPTPRSGTSPATRPARCRAAPADGLPVGPAGRSDRRRGAAVQPRRPGRAGPALAPRRRRRGGCGEGRGARRSGCEERRRRASGPAERRVSLSASASSIIRWPCASNASSPTWWAQTAVPTASRTCGRGARRQARAGLSRSPRGTRTRGAGAARKCCAASRARSVIAGRRSARPRSMTLTTPSCDQPVAGLPVAVRGHDARGRRRPGRELGPQPVLDVRGDAVGRSSQASVFTSARASKSGSSWSCCPCSSAQQRRRPDGGPPGRRRPASPRRARPGRKRGHHEPRTASAWTAAAPRPSEIQGASHWRCARSSRARWWSCSSAALTTYRGALVDHLQDGGLHETPAVVVLDDRAGQPLVEQGALVVGEAPRAPGRRRPQHRGGRDHTGDDDQGPEQRGRKPTAEVGPDPAADDGACGDQPYHRPVERRGEDEDQAAATLAARIARFFRALTCAAGCRGRTRGTPRASHPPAPKYPPYTPTSAARPVSRGPITSRSTAIVCRDARLDDGPRRTRAAGPRPVSRRTARGTAPPPRRRQGERQQDHGARQSADRAGDGDPRDQLRVAGQLAPVAPGACDATGHEAERVG